MDKGIWAVWYDLPDNGRESYLSWLHESYLPSLLTRPGYAWAAHYEITGGDGDMVKIHDTIARPGDPSVGTGTQFLMLVGSSSSHVFFSADTIRRDANLDQETQEMLARRIGARACVFSEEERVTGPEAGTRPPGTTPAPGIQMGSFRTKTLEDEFDIQAWYTQYRLPAMARMPGCVGARKLLSSAGWAKHSILYEFTSLEARQENFQTHESLGLDEQEWTGRVIRYTIHAPGSPSVGRRIWPAV